MNVIAITGASGLLGSNMALHALTNNLPLAVLSNSHRLCFESSQTIQIDLTDFVKTVACIRSLRPKHLIHCASLTNVDYCEQSPDDAHRINVKATQTLANIAHEINSSFTYISTDSVYDGKQGNYSESDPINPLNNYAATKYHGELAAMSAHPNALIIRTNLYGWNLQSKSSLAEWMLNQLENHTPLNGFKDVIFSPLSANDLSSTVFELINKQSTGIYNVGAHDSCSKYDFACKVAKLFSYPSSLITPISVDTVPFKAQRPKDTSLNVTKLEQLLNHKMPTIDQGLERWKHLQDSGYVNRLKSYGGQN